MPSPVKLAEQILRESKNRESQVSNAEMLFGLFKCFRVQMEEKDAMKTSCELYIMYHITMIEMIDLFPKLKK